MTFEQIKEMVENTLARKADLANRYPDDWQIYFHQAYGAVEFAMAVLNDWDKESIICEMWDEWKLKEKFLCL